MRTKRADAIKEKRRNRMTLSEASVDDVTVLTYDVTVCMSVYVHEFVFICVPVCFTLYVFFGMLNLVFDQTSGRVFNTRGRV